MISIYLNESTSIFWVPCKKKDLLNVGNKPVMTVKAWLHSANLNRCHFNTGTIHQNLQLFIITSINKGDF